MNTTDSASPPPAAAPRRALPAWRARLGLRLIHPLAGACSLLLLAALLWLSHHVAQEQPKLVRESLATFPEQVDGFHMIQEVPLTPQVLKVLRPTEVLVRYYQRRPEEPPVSLYIPFFAKQEEDSRIHNPAACLPGAGWQIVRRVRQPLPWRGKTAYANLVTLQKGLDWQMGLYWIHSRGRIVANEYRAKLYLMYDVFTRHRRDGALVRLMTVVPGGPQREEAMPEAKQRLLDFAKALLPILPRYLPD
ncbi:MAG: EpsI family protein [Nitrospirae bacterium]|nr:MAG: EpsI family protein [Nitrospirota bacterium]